MRLHMAQIHRPQIHSKWSRFSQACCHIVCIDCCINLHLHFLGELGTCVKDIHWDCMWGAYFFVCTNPLPPNCYLSAMSPAMQVPGHFVTWKLCSDICHIICPITVQLAKVHHVTNVAKIFKPLPYFWSFALGLLHLIFHTPNSCPC